MPILTTSVMAPPWPAKTPVAHIARQKPRRRAWVARTSGSTSRPRDHQAAIQLRKAVCSTARPSVSLIACAGEHRLAPRRQTRRPRPAASSRLRALGVDIGLGIIEQQIAGLDAKILGARSDRRTEPVSGASAVAAWWRARSCQMVILFGPVDGGVVQSTARIGASVGERVSARKIAARLAAPVISTWVCSASARTGARQRDARLGHAGRAQRHQHRRIGRQRLGQPVGAGKEACGVHVRHPCPSSSTVIGRCGAMPCGKCRECGLGFWGVGVKRHELRRRRTPAQQPRAQLPRCSSVARFRAPSVRRPETPSPCPSRDRHPRACRTPAPACCRPAHKARRARSRAAPCAKLAGDPVGQRQRHQLAVGVFDQHHSRISRQRRPSRCISISASSGPAGPGIIGLRPSPWRPPSRR